MNALLSLLDQPRLVLVSILALSVAALAAALVAEHGLGLQPCILCLYQRVPYAVTGVVAAAGLVFGRRDRRLTVAALLACAAGFAAEASIAFYHVGVEQHWWQAITACSGNLSPDLSLEDLKKAIMEAPLKRCDEITWTVLGLSVTVYNTAIGLLAGTAAAIAGLRTRQKDWGQYT